MGSSGIKIKVKTVKNKTHPPFQTVDLDVLFGTGIDYYGSLFDAALAVDCIQRKGSWYARDDVNFCQGRQNGIEYLKKHGDFAESLEKETIRLTTLAQQSDCIMEEDVAEDDEDVYEQKELLMNINTEETVLE